MTSGAKPYVAISQNHRSIITVLARNEDEAREAVREQLNRPGRRAYYNQWKEGGERVVERTTKGS